MSFTINDNKQICLETEKRGKCGRSYGNEKRKMFN